MFQFKSNWLTLARSAQHLSSRLKSSWFKFLQSTTIRIDFFMMILTGIDNDADYDDNDGDDIDAADDDIAQVVMMKIYRCAVS